MVTLLIYRVPLIDTRVPYGYGSVGRSGLDLLENAD
jgi:hypothetical protein